MGIRIFETDPDAAPKARFADDVVGRFRSGKAEGRSPVQLTEWRITTGDPEVATTVAGMYGGHPQQWDTSGEDNIEILTNMPSVPVIIDGPEAVTDKLVMWSSTGVKVHECDGVEYLDTERRGQPCGCPALLAERKEAARAGTGPKPEINVVFRLADDPELGQFRFQSSSWTLAAELHTVINALSAVGGPALCELEIVHVSYISKRGPRAGKTTDYHKPAIRVKGPATTDNE